MKLISIQAYQVYSFVLNKLGTTSNNKTKNIERKYYVENVYLCETLPKITKYNTI